MIIYGYYDEPYACLADQYGTELTRFKCAREQAEKKLQEALYECDAYRADPHDIDYIFDIDSLENKQRLRTERKLKRCMLAFDVIGVSCYVIGALLLIASAVAALTPLAEVFDPVVCYIGGSVAIVMGFFAKKISYGFEIRLIE